MVRLGSAYWVRVKLGSYLELMRVLSGVLYEGLKHL